MKEQRIREELTQCREILADLFQSGLNTVPEPLLERLRKESITVRQYGLAWLSDRFTELAGLVERRRHEIIGEHDKELWDLFCMMEEYLEAGIRQSGMDQAGAMIKMKDWEL